jgi:succinate dehydrogenase/fumarate reductase flavoprotein subunit
MNSQTRYDVIVVGAGGSGLAAAIEAARAGARVLVLEKAEKIGGTTSWSVGSFTSSSTPHQKRAGIVDSPEHHFEDMGKFNERTGFPDNLELRRVLTQNAPATLQWLMDLGVEFIGPNPEPPHRVPRMHCVVPNSAAYIYYLQKECARLGVTILCQRELVDLLESGQQVRGVKVRGPDGQETEFLAALGTVLATGDFASNTAVKRRFFGEEVVMANGVNPLATGDGITVAEAHGATILNGRHANAPRMRFVPAPPNWMNRLPPTRLISKVVAICWNLIPAQIIRPFLMRFLTTALGPEPTLFKCGAVLIGTGGTPIPVDLASIAFQLPRQPDNKGFIVFDAAVAEKLEQWPNFVSTAPGIAYAYLRDYRAARKDIFHQAPTIERLAQLIGVDAAQLGATLSAENEARTRERKDVQPLSNAPFYALGPVRGYVTITEGGLAINEKLQVLGADGRPMQGLYAAGSTGQGGMLLEGHGHHIAWAFVSGRIAGRNVLASAT